jgi:hypothetical protein
LPGQPPIVPQSHGIRHHVESQFYIPLQRISHMQGHQPLPLPRETNNKMSFSGGGNPRYNPNKPLDIEIQQPEEQNSSNQPQHEVQQSAMDFTTHVVQISATNQQPSVMPMGTTYPQPPQRGFQPYTVQLHRWCNKCHSRGSNCCCHPRHTLQGTSLARSPLDRPVWPRSSNPPAKHRLGISYRISGSCPNGSTPSGVERNEIPCRRETRKR